MRRPICIVATALACLCLSYPARGEGDLKAVDDYNFAAWLYNEGKYGLAIESYQAFLDNYPDHEKAVDARFGLAQSLFHQEKYKKAAEQYEQLRAHHRDFSQMPEVLFQLAQSQVALERFKEAEALFGEIREKYPDHYLADWALARQAACLISREEYAQAETLLQEFLARYLPEGERPEKVAATREMLNRLKKAGLSADKAFLSLVESSLFHLALSRFNQEEFPASVADFERFLSLYPKSDLAEEARFRKAQALYQEGEFKQAAEDYEDVASHKGDFGAAAAYERGLALYKAEDPKAAASAFAEMAERYPENPKAATARLYAGTFLYDTGDYKAAIDRLEPSAADGEPLADEARYWIGMSQLKAGNAGAAEDTLTKAIADFPKSSRRSDMMLGLADALLAQDKFPEAAEAFKGFTEAFPKAEQAPDALYSACVALHRADRYVDSDALCDRFLKTYGRDTAAPRVLFLSGENRFLMKQYKQAGDRYREFLSRKDIAPDRAARARFRLAWVYRQEKRPDDALHELEQIDREQTGERVGAEIDYLRGTCLFDKEQYGQAVQALTAYLDGRGEKSFGDDALFKMGLSHARQEQHKEAAEAYERLLKSYPGSPLAAQARYELAESYYDLKDYDRARAQYREVEKTEEPELVPYAMFGDAQCAYDQKKWQDAVDGFEALLEAYKDSELAPQAAYRKGRSLMELQRWSDAADTFRTLVEDGGKDALSRNAALMWANCLQKQKQWEEAAQAFARIIEEFPAGDDGARLRYEQAWSWREAGDTDKALAAFKALADKFPKDPLAADAFFYLAEARYTEKVEDESPAAMERRIDDARGLYEKVLATPESDRLADKAHYRIGWCHWLRDDYEDAVKEFDILIRDYPKSDLMGDALFQSAQSHARLGERDKAIELFKRLVEEDRFRQFDLRPEALVGLGEALVGASRPEEAIRYLTIVTSRHADSVAADKAFFLKGRALYDQQQYDEALESFEEVTRRTKSDVAAEAQFYIGQVYQAREDLREALKAYLRVIAIYPDAEDWVAAAYYESGRCHEALQEWGEAREAYREVVGKYRKTKWAEPASERLKSLTN